MFYPHGLHALQAPYEEEDTCTSYEEEDACLVSMRYKHHVTHGHFAEEIVVATPRV